MDKATVLSIVRHILTGVGGVLITRGVVTDAATVEAIVGGAIALVGVVWGVRDKRQPA